MRKIYIIGAVACLFTACKPSVNITNPPTNGKAQFTNYLAIGDNYTAGFADNSLTVTGQLNSFPERLFEQFLLVGAKGNFVQPLLSTDYGFPGPKKILAITHTACSPFDTSLGPIDFPNFTVSPADYLPYVSTINNGQINNMGAQGLRVVDFVFHGYAPLISGLGLPYAARFFHNPATASPKDELSYRVHNLHPTFFTLWLGLNDVLGYAAKYGGQGDGTGHALPTTLGLFNDNDISNVDTFRLYYDSLLNVAISEGAEGALINIPDIRQLPFFNTIPANGLTLNTQAEVDDLRARWPSTPISNYVFDLGANYFVIRDHNGNTRQSVPGEKILLSTPLDSLKCAGWGKTKPIPEKYVLTTDELQFIKANTDLFNEYIRQEASLHKLAYVDMNTYLNTLATGFAYYGINYSTEYVKGGAYSLDGIHFTQRGYALIANYILGTVNTYYHSTIPMVDVNKYHGIDFP